MPARLSVLVFPALALLLAVVPAVDATQCYTSSTRAARAEAATAERTPSRTLQKAATTAEADWTATLPSAVVMRTYCPTAGDVKIHDIARQGCAPATPLYPEGWNAPGVELDASWQSGSRVWWDDWNQPTWRPERIACGQPIGLVDAHGQPLGLSGTTYLYRYIFDLTPPRAEGMQLQVRRATLELWSDNESRWWWEGKAVPREQASSPDQIDLPMLVGTMGGQYLLAGEVDNDCTCTDNSYCNPHGASFRLTVIWAPGDAQTRWSLPLASQSTRHYRLVEEFDMDAPWEPVPGDHPAGRIEPSLSRAEIDLQDAKTRYLYRSIEPLTGGDFVLTVAVSLAADQNDCGVAIALRRGQPTEGETHILDRDHPGAVIAVSHNQTQYASPFDHIHAEWVYARGGRDTTHHDWRHNSNGTIIPISQTVKYVATLEVLSSDETATLTVYDDQGNSKGTISVQEDDYRETGFEDTFGTLDTLIIGHSLPREMRQGDRCTCRVTIDSVTLFASEGAGPATPAP